MASDINRSLGLISIRATRAFEFKTAVVRYIDLLIRVIDEEHVRADGEPSPVRRRSGLVEIGRRKMRLLWCLNHSSSVDAVDAAGIVRVPLCSNQKWYYQNPST